MVWVAQRWRVVDEPAAVAWIEARSLDEFSEVDRQRAANIPAQLRSQVEAVYAEADMSAERSG